VAIEGEINREFGVPGVWLDHSFVEVDLNKKWICFLSL